MTYKPSEREEEYFKRLEFENKKKIEEERQKAMAEKEKAQLRELHFMHCPKCGMNLIEIDYKGVKVDKCSSCEGVWLDAGELEMVSEKDKGFMDNFFKVFKR